MQQISVRQAKQTKLDDGLDNIARGADREELYYKVQQKKTTNICNHVYKMRIALMYK
jgi:hypothetical protein